MKANQTVREKMRYRLHWGRLAGVMARNNFPIKELRPTGPASNRPIRNLAPPLFGLIVQGYLHSFFHFSFVSYNLVINICVFGLELNI